MLGVRAKDCGLNTIHKNFHSLIYLVIAFLKRFSIFPLVVNEVENGEHQVRGYNGEPLA